MPRDAIPEAATALRADLVIIGTTGRSGLSGWLIGNTAETILGRLGCSVLIVPPLRTDSPPSVC
ncbi:universal stress protein [Lamprobacter modestohalophilus]|uniref:universal stress protein n=1 Tax=Lamprobacter modestohalophilus TaxID=1064514 RepID=UPI003D1881E2